MICIWDKLTISPPVGFDIYSAQQTRPLWYNAYSVFSFPSVFKTRDFRAVFPIQLLILHHICQA